MGLFPSSAGAQGRAFTHLIGVNTTQLSNGVSIEFVFDGIFEFEADPEPEWVNFDGNTEAFFPVRRIRFSFPNARTQAGAFFDISRYPVSHVEVSIPPGAPEGVGLDAVVSLVQPATFGGLRTSNNDWCCWESKPPYFIIRESQDRRKLIVTVISDRLPQQPEARRSQEDVANLPSALSVDNQGGILSVRASNAPLKAVAQAISEATGVRLTVDDELSRVINLHFPATSLLEVLGTLERGYDLAISPHPKGVGLWITDGSPEEGTRFPALATGFVPFEYLNALDAADLFPDFLRRFIRPDEQKNGLVVTGSHALIEKVRRDAAILDKPPAQIEVQVTAVEARSSDGLLLGLGAATEQRQFRGSFDSQSGEIFFSTLNAPKVFWEARLQALQTDGQLRIVAEPKIRVSNGKESSLFIGNENFIQVLRGRRRLEAQLENVRSGVELEVTPWTGGNGEITMRLRPSLSLVLDRTDEGLPIVDNRSARTTLRSKDGETIIIGGLSSQSEFMEKHKIPILGDLPLIGGLFRWKQRSREQSDLVLFVTARIVGTGGENTAPTTVGGKLEDLVGG